MDVPLCTDAFQAPKITTNQSAADSTDYDNLKAMLHTGADVAGSSIHSFVGGASQKIVMDPEETLYEAMFREQTQGKSVAEDGESTYIHKYKYKL